MLKRVTSETTPAQPKTVLEVNWLEAATPGSYTELKGTGRDGEN